MVAPIIFRFISLLEKSPRSNIKKKIGLKYVYMYVSGTPEISLTEMPFHPPANLRVDLLLSRAKHITDDKVVK